MILGLLKRLQIGAQYKLHSSVKMYLPDQKKTEAMLPEELLKTKKVQKRYYSEKNWENIKIGFLTVLIYKVYQFPQVKAIKRKFSKKSVEQLFSGEMGVGGRPVNHWSYNSVAL
jgi:hypothetical protein